MRYQKVMDFIIEDTRIDGKLIKSKSALIKFGTQANNCWLSEQPVVQYL